nr:hypothetical protein [Tanacetum cinerariifolium]
MILQTSSPTLRNPSTRLTYASYVEMILTMLMIVHHDSRLSMSWNRVIIKTLVILYPYNSPSFLCSKNCDGPHESFQCQPMNRNYFEPNSSSFDQFQPPQYPVVHQPPQETKKCIALLRAEEKYFKVKKALKEEQNQPKIIQELLFQLIHDLKLLNEIQPKQAEKRINSLFQDQNPLQFFIILDGDDDDDDYEKESIISTNTDIFETTSSDEITISPPILPIMDPEDSLIIGNEELSTILEKESDEFIKSSVEDLVPIPSESEDTSESESVCILPLCDDFSPIDIPEEKADSYDSNLDKPDLLFTHLFDAIKMSVSNPKAMGSPEPPLEENDELFDLEPKNDDWKKILYGAPILMIEDKVFDPEIHYQNLSPTYTNFIKSSVEDLVPIPSESKDTSGSDSECILPSCDYFSPIDVPEEKTVTFSNLLFNSNDDFISSDDE